MSSHEFKKSVSSDVSVEDNEPITIDSDDSEVDDHSLHQVNGSKPAVLKNQVFDNSKKTSNIDDEEDSDKPISDSDEDEYEEGEEEEEGDDDAEYEVYDSKSLNQHTKEPSVPKIQVSPATQNSVQPGLMNKNTPVVSQPTKTLDLDDGESSTSITSDQEFHPVHPAPIDLAVSSAANTLASEGDDDEDDFFSMSNMSHQSLPLQQPLSDQQSNQNQLQQSVEPSISSLASETDNDPFGLPAPKFTLQRVLSPSPEPKQSGESMNSSAPADFTTNSLAAAFKPTTDDDDEYDDNENTNEDDESQFHMLDPVTPTKADFTRDKNASKDDYEYDNEDYDNDKDLSINVYHDGVVNPATPTHTKNLNFKHKEAEEEEEEEEEEDDDDDEEEEDSEFEESPKEALNSFHSRENSNDVEFSGLSKTNSSQSLPKMSDFTVPEDSAALESTHFEDDLGDKLEPSLNSTSINLASDKQMDQHHHTEPLAAVEKAKPNVSKIGDDESEEEDEVEESDEEEDDHAFEPVMKVSESSKSSDIVPGDTHNTSISDEEGEDEPEKEFEDEFEDDDEDDVEEVVNTVHKPLSKAELVEDDDEISYIPSAFNEPLQKSRFIEDEDEDKTVEASNPVHESPRQIDNVEDTEKVSAVDHKLAERDEEEEDDDEVDHMKNANEAIASTPKTPSHICETSNNHSLFKPDSQDDDDQELPEVVLTLNDGEDLDASPAYDNSEVFPELTYSVPLHTQNPFDSVDPNVPATRALDDILNNSVALGPEDKEDADYESEPASDQEFEPELDVQDEVKHLEADRSFLPIEVKHDLEMEEESEAEQENHETRDIQLDDHVQLDDAKLNHDVHEKLALHEPFEREEEEDEKVEIEKEDDDEQESDKEEREVDNGSAPKELVHEAALVDENTLENTHILDNVPLKDTIEDTHVDVEEEEESNVETHKNAEPDLGFIPSVPAPISKFVSNLNSDVSEEAFKLVDSVPQTTERSINMGEQTGSSDFDFKPTHDSDIPKPFDAPMAKSAAASQGFDFSESVSLENVEISKSPPPIPVENLSPQTLARRMTASSASHFQSIAADGSATVVASDLQNVPFDDVNDYESHEASIDESLQRGFDDESAGHLAEAFKFPGSPRAVSHPSSYSNVTRAARSESITGGASFNMSSPKEYNSNNRSISASSPQNSQSYMTTFEAPTNLPELSGSLEDKEEENIPFGFTPIDSPLPTSAQGSAPVLRSTPSNHSVTLSPIEADAATMEEEDPENIIFAVCVVGFHHIRGPEVEYWVGGDGKDQSKLWPNLPFQSLPDGSHSHEENFCYFSLLYDTKNKTAPISVPTRDKVGNVIENVPDMSDVTTLFGISCNRQLKATDLKERPADVTRSTVQKSVVVIARKPIFGAIREKLAVITRAYFQQGDFEDRSLIDSLYENLDQIFSNKIDENDMYVGMSVRELVYRLRSKVLVLLKALLLEKKVFFYGNNTEVLCASQFALVSLIPNLINHLDDCGSPLLKTYETKLKKPNSLKSSDRNSLLNYMGLPLQLFAEGGMFTAYVPLQQMNELKAPETKYFLVGSTNSLLLAPQNRVSDIVVYVDNANVEIVNSGLNSALSLSSSDKKWMDMVVKAVVDTWDPEDPGRPKGLGFHGSEDFVRQHFEDYIKGLLATIKYDKFLARASQLKQPISIPRDIGTNHIKNFNNNWIKEWRTTNNFRIFSKFTDDELFDIVEPKHVAFTMEPPSVAKSVDQQSSNQVPNADSSNDSGAARDNSNNNGATSESGSETVPTENVATKVTKVWESLWWKQSQSSQPSQQNTTSGSHSSAASLKSASTGITSENNDNDGNGNNGGHGANDENNEAGFGTSPSMRQGNNKLRNKTSDDDFQETSLYDSGELVPSNLTMSHGNNSRNSPDSGRGSHGNNSVDGFVLPTSSPSSSSATAVDGSSSNDADMASHKPTRSTASSFFNGWSLWGNKDNNDHVHNSSTTSNKSS